MKNTPVAVLQFDDFVCIKFTT